MTTLKDFVSEALVQFLSGIQAAQQDPEVGKYVAPAIHGGPALKPVMDSGIIIHQGEAITSMKFDVAVTADSSSREQEGGKLKAGLSVMEFGLSSKIEATGEETKRFENVSRVQFAVHVQLPRSTPQG